ncbi:hypothetical protein GQM33_20560 [Escherichia coli]|nr:hypothetical protein GP725_20560 [Escherichia coli]MWK72044.1 hypothetical protein [Escherichia coli]
MLKPDSLRRALTDAVTVLKTSPEMLRIFVDSGVLHQPGYRSGRYLHGNTGQSVRL